MRRLILAPAVESANPIGHEVSFRARGAPPRTWRALVFDRARRWLVVDLLGGNESGRLSAVGTGDVSAPAARAHRAGRRAPPRARSLPPPGRAGPLSRAPYLQRVTAHDAVVAWTSPGAASASVLVETPDGAPVGSFAAAIDTSAPLAGGVKQWTAAVTGLAPDTQYCYTVYQDGAPRDGARAAAQRAAGGRGRAASSSSRWATRAAAAATSGRCSSRSRPSRSTS